MPDIFWEKGKGEMNDMYEMKHMGLISLDKLNALIEKATKYEVLLNGIYNAWFDADALHEDEVINTLMMVEPDRTEKVMKRFE